MLASVQVPPWKAYTDSPLLCEAATQNLVEGQVEQGRCGSPIHQRADRADSCQSSSGQAGAGVEDPAGDLGSRQRVPAGIARGVHAHRVALERGRGSRTDRDVCRGQFETAARFRTVRTLGESISRQRCQAQSGGPSRADVKDDRRARERAVGQGGLRYRIGRRYRAGDRPRLRGSGHEDRSSSRTRRRERWCPWRCENG